MFGNTKKKLIVVCDKKTEKYANYLRQLVSQNDDSEGEVRGVPDGAVDVAVWLDSDYLANKAQLSSSEHIIFLGNNKVTKSEMSSMIVKFDKCGMKYGWLGKRAMMIVEDTDVTQEEYDEFIGLCQGYEVEFERLVLEDSSDNISDITDNSEETIDNSEEKCDVAEENNNANKMNSLFNTLEKSSRFIAEKSKLVASEVSSGVKKVQFHIKYRDQQYRALAVIMYLDGLVKFLEE